MGRPARARPPRFPRVPTVPAMRAANPFGSDEKTSTSMQNLPKVGGASSNNLPPVGPRPLVQPPRRKSNVIQKRLASSGFDEEERTQIDAVLGRSKSVELDLDEEVPTGTTEFYDGETPAPEVVDQRDLAGAEGAGAEPAEAALGPRTCGPSSTSSPWATTRATR